MHRRIAITYGTFDFCHVGHMNLLKRIRNCCDYLIVGLSSDEFNTLKGKQSFYCYEKRKEMLESTGFVDLIIQENTWEQKINDIEKYHVDTLFMGDDWTGKFDYLSKYCKIVYLTRTPNISSTQIKQELKLHKEENIHAL